MTKRKDVPPPPKTSNGRNANLVRANAFKKGQPRPPDTGRKKGQRNRVTTMLKDAILLAAAQLGQDGKGKDGLTGYLMMLASKERAVFAKLLEKVLPMQLHLEDKTVRKYTAAEATRELEARGIPVPLGLAQLASGMIRAVEPDIYQDELNGIGYEGAELQDSDSEIGPEE